MGTLKKRTERAEEINDPNVVKVVTDADGNAILFFTVADSLPARAGFSARFQRHRALLQAPGIVYLPALIFCWGIRICRSVLSNARSVWSSYAHWKMDSRFGWWKRNMSHWASIRRRIGNECHYCLRN